MSRASVLKDRAKMLARARAFFQERDILEIDCNAMVKRPPIDSNIECIRVDQDSSFLHTSPEYALKRLLAEGIGDCYFLGHVFRKGEIGSLHNPEFTMAEWYRVGLSFEEMIQESAAFLFLFFGEKKIETLSFRKAFETYIGIDYKKEPLENLQRLTQSSWDRPTCLQSLLTEEIEPKLGRGKLSALIEYPPEEAALACVEERGGELVAMRFEIYYEGVELCNGYKELADPSEIANRFEKINLERLTANLPPYPLDEKFLLSLQKLPPCCGVALGFDRAMMLRHKVAALSQVLPFAWSEC